MKLVTQNSINAFNSNTKGTFGGNTRVEVQENGATLLLLFENLIAVNDNGKLKITDAGWQSKTTKERLNGLRGVNIQQKKGDWFLNGELWNGRWIEVK